MDLGPKSLTELELDKLWAHRSLLAWAMRVVRVMKGIENGLLDMQRISNSAFESYNALLSGLDQHPVHKAHVHRLGKQRGQTLEHFYGGMAPQTLSASTEQAPHAQPDLTDLYELEDGVFCDCEEFVGKINEMLRHHRVDVIRNHAGLVCKVELRSVLAR